MTAFANFSGFVVQADVDGVEWEGGDREGVGGLAMVFEVDAVPACAVAGEEGRA